MDDDRTLDASRPNPLGYLLALAAFVVVVAGMKAAQSIMVPFLLSLFIAIVVTPAFVIMRRNGVPSVVALLVLIGVVVGAGFGVVALISSSVTDFSSNLPAYQETLQQKTQAFMTWLDERGVDAPDKLVAESLNPQAAMGFAGTLVNSLSTLVGNSFLILLTVVFILLEASGFPAKLKQISQESGENWEDLATVAESVRHYMAIKTVVSLITGGLITVWLTILGVHYAMLWGLLAFMLNYVPSIGSIIAAFPPLAIALVDQGLGTAAWVGAGFLVVNVVIGNILEPKIMGKGLGLSTLVVFLSLVFWGWVFGPIGMLLSVPLTMTFKIILESWENTRWIAVLVGAPPEGN